MNRAVNVVFLWSMYTGYVHAVAKEVRNRVSQLDVVHWDKKTINSNQYNLCHGDGINFFPRTSTSDEQILSLLKSSNPAIIVVSGWMDKGYLKAVRALKRINPRVRVVAGIDDQWTGSPRQMLGRVYYRFAYRSLFDYLWVSGAPQFAYAQRFGYSIENIIGNLLTADTSVFRGTANPLKRFVFAGRFVEIKALDMLVDAYERLPAKDQSDWPLVLIGDGEKKEAILKRDNENISVLPFMQPDKLRTELLKGGVACLPSHQDQWGVVVHEYALLGLPMILSSGVGAATEFLISGFNGLMFEKANVNSLSKALTRLTSLDLQSLSEMGRRSQMLASRITPEISANSLLSVITAG